MWNACLFADLLGTQPANAAKRVTSRQTRRSRPAQQHCLVPSILLHAPALPHKGQENSQERGGVMHIADALQPEPHEHTVTDSKITSNL